MAIGNFDGVHLGHARIVERLVKQARRVQGPAVVFTFDPHPARLLRPDMAPPPLTWIDRKTQLLAELGIDFVVAYPTDEELLKKTPDQFFQTIIREGLNAHALVEGPNFYFGQKRAGTIDVLRTLCQSVNMELEIVEPMIYEGEIVSSSRIRRLIGEGHVQQAAKLLTHPYRIRGMVAHGAGRGAKIGFPTANLAAIDTLLPGPGVYAGRAMFQGSVHPAAINIGPNPTFGENVLKVEIHLLDFNQSLYGEPLEVDFLSKLRDIQPFPDVNALKNQLVRDVAATREIVRSHRE